MIQAEKNYLELVGIEGHQKAVNSFDVLFNQDVPDSIVTLYYLTLTNAYWRGVNAGVDKARAIIAAKKGTVDGNGKPIN